MTDPETFPCIENWDREKLLTETKELHMHIRVLRSMIADLRPFLCKICWGQCWEIIHHPEDDQEAIDQGFLIPDPEIENQWIKCLMCESEHLQEHFRKKYIEALDEIKRLKEKQ